MKKFNFLFLSFVTLFMFCGFSSIAQWKPLHEAMAITESTVAQKTQVVKDIKLEAGMALGVSANPAPASQNPNRLNDIFIIRYGNALMDQFKAGITDVGMAIANTDLHFATQGGKPQYIAARNVAANHYKQLLKS